MSESPYEVGYGRPPVHTRFQKGQSGHPGGRPRPKKSLRLEFEQALDRALNSEEETLRGAKPTKVVESLARQLAIDALDGQTPARRLVLSILDGEADEVLTPDDPRAGDECRRVLGDRFDELKQKFDAAIAAGSDAELVAIAKEFRELA